MARRDGGSFPGIHTVADEAAKKLEPLSLRLGRWIGNILESVSHQIYRFRHSLALIGIAAMLVLVLSTGDISNLIPVVALLGVLAVVWTAITSFNFEADEKSPARQELDAADRWEED